MIRSMYDFKFLLLLDEIKFYLSEEKTLKEKEINFFINDLKLFYLDMPLKKDTQMQLNNYFPQQRYEIIIHKIKKLALLKKFETYLNALKLNLTPITLDFVLKFAKENNLSAKKVYKAYSHNLYKKHDNPARAIFCEY